MSDTKAIVLPAMIEAGLLNKQIDSVNKRASNLMGDYQDVGVHALMHLAAHGDVSYVNRILAGMPKGTKVNAMASWMLAYGKLEVNKDAATKKSMPLRFSAAKKMNVEGAIADAWYNHMPEKAIDEVFDLSKAINAIIAKAKAEGVTTIKVNGTVIDSAAAAKKLEALAAFALVK